MHKTYTRLRGFQIDDHNAGGYGDSYRDGDSYHGNREGNGDDYGDYHGDGGKPYCDDPDGNGFGDGGDDSGVEYGIGDGNGGMWDNLELLFEVDD